jgi:hypothetical protein
MALAVAPVAVGLMDKEAVIEYSSTAAKAALFNASLRAVTVRGAQELSSDREAGTIRGLIPVSGGQAAYEFAILVDANGRTSKLRISGKSASVFKLHLGTSAEFVEGVVRDIESGLGSKLTRI